MSLPEPRSNFRRWAAFLGLAVLLGLLAAGTALAAGGPAWIGAWFASPTPTITPTPSETPTPGPSPTPSATFTATSSPTLTPTSTATYTVTPSPTAGPRGEPTLGYYDSTPATPPPTEIPTPVGRIPVPHGVTNILLIGTDTLSEKSYRTDTMIVVSVNKETGSVTLISIPRDLYVFIPQWTMQRINTTYTHGNSVGYPGGGSSLLIQTILYNLGLPIHRYVRVDFSGFKQIVDTLGGIDVPVWCELEDYVLKVPADYDSMTPQQRDAYASKPENWEPYVVPVGIRHMDGADALLYARLRQSYRSYVALPTPERPVSDYDRARRQQQIMRAVYQRALNVDVIPRIPELFAQFRAIMDTDMGLGDVLQFVPLAGKLDDTQVRSRFIGQGYVTAWTNPHDRANVLLPKPEEIRALLEEAMQPPAGKQLARAATCIEVWNGTSRADWDVLAANRLGWEGYAVAIGTADRSDYASTLLVDFTSSPKGSARNDLMRQLNIKPENVISRPDANSPFQFRVILGDDYDTCAPPAPPTPTPTATFTETATPDPNATPTETPTPSP